MESCVHLVSQDLKTTKCKKEYIEKFNVDMVAYMMARGVPQQAWRKGPWTPEEDKLLSEHVHLHGEGRWSSVARCTGLNRNGKSCRLRWVNYLRPGLKRGHITPQEEGIIVELHALWGNKWSTIARYLPGRTDNEIKNYWRTHFKRKEKSSQKQEKQKAQVLKQKQRQPHQQQKLLDDDNMKKVGISVDDKMQETAGKPEMCFTFSSGEYQCLPQVTQDIQSWVDSVVEDYWLWDGLWNLDDQQQDHFGYKSHCNKVALQNQATSYPFDADSNNINGGGNIF